MFEKAVDLDPEYANAKVKLGWTYLIDWLLGWSQDPQSLDRTFELAKEAKSIDDSLSHASCLEGNVYLWKKQHDAAIAVYERAIKLNPNYADALAELGGILNFSGRPEEAISLVEKAIRLNPLHPYYYLYHLGHAYLLTGRYEKALETLNVVISRNPDFFPARLFLAALHSELGRESEAEAEVEKILKRSPETSLHILKQRLPYKDHKTLERLVHALRKAGLPDYPPLPLPEEPSIAVLPFDNMSEDPGQEYFVDGVTEQIITGLSKIPKLFVIARNSTFTYKGKPVKVQQVGRELGVRYVLEGSIQKAGDRVRINAQLIDTGTGRHLWAERYDRELKDIFALQDEITLNILTAMQVKLTEGEQAYALAKGTDNLDAYLKLLKAREYIRRFKKEDNVKGRQIIEEVIDLDPEYPVAYVGLAFSHIMDVWFGWSESPDRSLTVAENLAEKALAMDETLSGTRSILGHIYLLRGQHDMAIAEGERAVALYPNEADAYELLATAYKFGGQPEKAIPLYKKAIRLNPIPPGYYLQGLAMAYFLNGQHEKAIEAYKKSLERNPDLIISRLGLAAIYSLSGREEEARASAAEVLRINPGFSVEHFVMTKPFKDQGDRELFMNALRKAGLK